MANLQVSISLCRVCMKSEIGTSMLSDDSLQQKFEFVTHLRVKQDDNLPAIICDKCIILLNLSHKFIQSAIETEKNLRTFLAKIKNDFQLVTKSSSSPTKNDANNDDIDEMLMILRETEETEETDETPPVTSTKYIENKEECTIESSQKKYNTEVVDGFSPVDETFSPKPTIDEDKLEKFVENNADTLRSSITSIQEGFTEEKYQIIEYNQLDDSLIAEETEDEDETTSQERLQDDQMQNKITYLEDYGAILSIDDENSTMDDILYEDAADVFQLQQQQQEEPSLSSDTASETFDVSLQETPTPTPTPSPSLSSSATSSSMIDAMKISNEIKKRSSSSKRLPPKTTRKINSLVADSTRFYCSKCNRDFSTKTNLTRHMQLHTGKRPYKCKICSKNFSQKGTLKQHTYIHTGEKPYVCNVCNRGFTQSKSLVFHMRRHTGDKPHQCDYCGTLFRQKDALKNHILRHHTANVGERNTCKICNKEMSVLELNSHMKSHLNNHKTKETTKSTEITTPSAAIAIDGNELLNDGESIFLSDEFSVDVDGSTHVIDVMATSTTEPSRAKKYQCRTCFKCFAIKKNLIRHLSFHDVPASELQQCQECGLLFDYSTNYALKVHRVREHKDISINLNECDDCEMKFQNAEELRLHLQYLHSFSCPRCPNISFTTKKQYNDHLLEHSMDEIEEND